MDDPMSGQPDDEPTIAELAANVERLRAEAHALAADPDVSHSTELVATGDDAAAIKQRMAATRAAMRHKENELVAAQESLRRRLDIEMSNARAALTPLKERMAVLSDGIHTLSLYLGADESIVPLADGDPAEASEPIVIRQMVLAMDEECRIAAETGGLDAHGVRDFDRWLTSNPDHLDQVFPEQRGIVVLVPTRQRRYYGSPWADMMMADANSKSYWLIRNGDRLYRMTTDIEVGERLIPARDEFTSFFRTRTWEGEWVDIQPGSKAWLDAEKKADDRRRHYMKTALVIQGLIDRTTVLHPLPAPAISVLQNDSYDAGHVRLVTDAEQAIGTGMTPFREWLRGLNARLRPGMRVLGAFGSEGFRQWRSENGDGHERITPRGASYPPSNEILTIDRVSGDGGFVIKYARTDKRWGYEHRDADGYEWGTWGEWPYKTRASVTVYSDDSFVLPFDLVTVPELERYLNARTERHNYIELVPLMKAAIAAKRVEHEAEAPVRQMLAGVIARDCGVTVAEAEAAVPALVDWWKLGNRWHRPLVVDDKVEARLVKAVVAEFRMRRRGDEIGDRHGAREGQVVERMRAAVPDLLAVARKADGTFVGWSPCNDDNVFVNRWTARLTKDGVRPDGEWQVTGTAWRRWRMLWSSDRWSEWDHEATLSTHLSDPDIERLAQTAFDQVAQREARAFAVTYRPGDQDDERVNRFFVYYWDEPRLPDPERLLTADRFHLHGVRDHVRAYTWTRQRGAAVLRPKSCWRGVPNLDLDAALVVDEAQVAERAAAQRSVDEMEARRKELWRIAEHYITAIRAEWTRRWEAAEYAKFIDEYLDPDLWEGHRKTLREPNGPIYFNSRNRVAYAVEAGIELGGLTVAEMVAATDHLAKDDALELLSMGDFTLPPVDRPTTDE